MNNTSNASRKRKRRQYTAEQRAEILAAVEDDGVVEAARRHSVPQTTVSNWLHRDAVKTKSKVTAMKRAMASPASETQTKKGGEDARTDAGVDVHQREEADRAQLHAEPESTGTRTRIDAWGELRIEAAGHEPVRDLRLAAQARKGECGQRSVADERVPRRRRSRTSVIGRSSASGRKHPGLGPSQIRNQLRRRGVKVSVTTTRRVMEDAGYRPPKVKREPHDERFEAVRPNHLWHLDFVHRNIHRASTFTLILIDDCARFVTGHGIDDAERAEMVIRTFEEAVERHGKPERVMHDRGAAFWSWRGISRFTALLAELGYRPGGGGEERAQRQGRGVQREPA